MNEGVTETQPLFDKLEACPLCESPESEIIRIEHNDFPDDRFFEPYKNASVRLRRCRTCGFCFNDEVPKDAHFFDKLYGYLKPDWSVEFKYHGKKLVFRDIRQKILRHKNGGTLLDVGTWSGAFLAEMADRFDVTGVELNPAGASYARSQGLRVESGRFHDVNFSPESFDVITITDVLEHLPQPRMVLEKAARLLKHEGILAIKVPNVRGQIWKQNLANVLHVSKEGVAQNYTHINHFTRASLTKVLEQLGFEVLESGPANVVIWNLRHPVPTPLLVRRAVINLVRRAVTEVINLAARVSPVELELNLFVLVRKR